MSVNGWSQNKTDTLCIRHYILMINTFDSLHIFSFFDQSAYHHLFPSIACIPAVSFFSPFVSLSISISGNTDHPAYQQRVDPKEPLVAPSTDSHKHPLSSTTIQNWNNENHLRGRHSHCNNTTLDENRATNN